MDELEHLFPEQLEQALTVVADREAILSEARAEAGRIVEAVRREQAELVRQTDLHAQAQAAACSVLQEAEAEAAELRRETDDYIDHKFASFEVALTKTLRAVGQGRDKLADGMNLTAVHSDPATASQEVDRWVEDKLTRFEEALQQTMESVVRGRERLRERSGLDGPRELEELADPPDQRDPVPATWV